MLARHSNLLLLNLLKQPFKGKNMQVTENYYAKKIPQGASPGGFLV
ncbi:hypothetical protein HPTD01_769 [Halomonas sp. TD01]|nr:hypothetical protein HPTD01_769 [Halomonas sp. TD01]